MLKSYHSSPLQKKLRKIATLCLAVALVSLAVQAPRGLAAFNARITFSPEFAKLPIGGTFTLTVNLTNFANLYLWQVGFKYNATVLNLTSIWVPADNVFAGHTSIPVPLSPEFILIQGAGDSNDGLNWTLYGNTLLGSDQVAVTNGILLKANFTVLNQGETSIRLATTSAAIYRNHKAAYWSSLADSDFNYYDEFILPAACAILSGVANAAPTATFTIAPPSPDLLAGRYVLPGNPPGDVVWVPGYENLPIVFNASESMDPDGYITQYIWDFADGNITTVNVNYNATGNATIDIPAGRQAALAAAVITHVYNMTYPYAVTLIVVDNGNPDPDFYAPPTSSAKSTPVYSVIGLLLDYFDWNPLFYGVAAIIAVLIVYYAMRRILVFTRERRTRAQAKVTVRSQNEPPPETKPQKP